MDASRGVYCPRNMNDVVHDIALKHAGEMGGLLPCLHEGQERLGYIPAQAHRQLA